MFRTNKNAVAGRREMCEGRTSGPLNKKNDKTDGLTYKTEDGNAEARETSRQDAQMAGALLDGRQGNHPVHLREAKTIISRSFIFSYIRFPITPIQG